MIRPATDNSGLRTVSRYWVFSGLKGLGSPYWNVTYFLSAIHQRQTDVLCERVAVDGNSGRYPGVNNPRLADIQRVKPNTVIARLTSDPANGFFG